MSGTKPLKFVVLIVCFVEIGAIFAQPIQNPTPEQWITVTEQAAGMTQKAKDEAIAKALRRAVEQACGVFLTSESKSKNYKGVYDQVFADAVGYVKEYDVDKTWIQDGAFHAKVTALVSTRKFEKDWAVIAHTYAQEKYPRVIVVIGETTYEMVNELEQENKREEVDTIDLKAEHHARGEATAGGVAGYDADAAAVSGTVSRRGRVRPRNWAVMSASERQAWLARYEAEAHSEDTLTGTATHSRTDSAKTWRRVASEMKEGGTVQTKIEDFFLDKGIKLVDRGTARNVNKRDLMLASAQEDFSRVAALGAQFDADVVILGTAAAKSGGETEITVADRKIKQHEYRAKLVVRAIRTDSAQLMVSKVYQANSKSMRKGGEETVLDKLADESAPKLLSAVVEAWRKQVHVTRDIQVQIAGMSYDDFKTFKEAAEKLRGVKAISLREITEGVANIYIGYEFSTQNLADNLTELKEPKLEITEFNPNRLKMKVVKKK
ncbi:MAG: hypothetical protein JXA11_11950 [Phycisphaerae bacterium]|nr:hypothetical protein [Phycisphaerae bacterium]